MRANAETSAARTAAPPYADNKNYATLKANMKSVYRIHFHSGSKEELLPDFSDDFPYIASRAEIGCQTYRFAPWHWHKAIELFYIEQGVLEYRTQHKQLLFPKGTGGFVNSNVLHMTKPQQNSRRSIQLLHIFDASFISGEHGSRIEQNYVLPVISSSFFDLLALYPQNPQHKEIIERIRAAFSFSENDTYYELRLRDALSHIWQLLFSLMHPQLHHTAAHSSNAGNKLKLMMAYIYEHYPDKISVAELASEACISERECYRIFQEHIRMPPAEYIQKYRIQMACRMLCNTDETVSAIGYACGLGSSSYFGKVFREATGQTPLQYRAKWQNSDINSQ